MIASLRSGICSTRNEAEVYQHGFTYVTEVGERGVGVELFSCKTCGSVVPRKSGNSEPLRIHAATHKETK